MRTRNRVGDAFGGARSLEGAAAQCPRPESNQRTRFRKPLLYPLSYGGS